MRTQRSMLMLALAAALAVGAGAPAFAASTQDHAHGVTAPAKLTLDHGKKWTTDAPLRKRMGEIRTLFANQLAAIHAGKLSAGDYQALGLAVEQQVGGIVAECRLPPEADAMLHLIVAELLEGADIMQGKAAGKPAEGAHRVVVAANNYGRYFDHKGWKPLG